MINEYINDIESLKKQNLYRKLSDSEALSSNIIRKNNQNLISFACNDYLGLSHNLALKKSAILAIKKYGVGARASRYITGNNIFYGKLEKALAKFYKNDDSVVFASGYSCAIGVVKALVGEGDLIIADKLIHACLIDGAQLSQAKLIRFNHNNIEHCLQILQENRHQYKKCLILTETIFSMDGDVGKISELLNLANQFDAILLSDDAHGLGQNILPHSRHLQMGTLSKALGGLGGFVVGDKILIEYLRQFARSAIYSTALPPAILASSLQALKIISRKNLAQKSVENAQYFCQLMNLPKPESSIVIIIIGESKKVVDIAKKVAENGFLIASIRPPTVPKNQARLRLTFSASHRKNDIKKLVKVLKIILEYKLL
jgi:8-amino-7-oxononanoate synthase